MQLNIARKVSLFTICATILFTLLLCGLFFWHENRVLNRELDSRVRSLLENLRITAEYPVLIKDHDAISRLGNGMLAQKDIFFCQIVDSSGHVLFQEGTAKEKHIREYTCAIVTERVIDRETDEEVLFGGVKKTEEEIGRIYLRVSLSALYEKLNDVRNVMLVVIIGVASLLYFLLSFLLRSVLGRPLEYLVLGFEI